MVGRAFTRRLLVACSIGTLLIFSAFEASADQTETIAGAPGSPKETTPDKGENQIPNWNAYPLQLLDEPLQPLIPKQPRTEADQTRIEAMAHFMTGELLVKRRRFKEAMAEMKKAVELDPNAAEVYRTLIPLAFELDEPETALRYVEKVAELDADNYRLLRRLGIHLAAIGQIPKAVMLLETAVKSSSLEKASADYVTLSRDLGVLYGAIGEKEKAADAYQVVFEARTEPQKFKLDFRTRRALKMDKTTSFERIGRAFLDADRPVLATRAFNLAAEEGQIKPGVLSYNLARVYLQTGEHDKALEELQNYFDAQLQSQGRDAYQLLADILKAANRQDELLSRLEAIAEKDRRNNTLQYFLAEQYLLSDQLEKAENLFRKTLKENGGREGYVGLAAVYRRQSRPKELLDALAEAFDGGAASPQLIEEMQAILEDEKLLNAVIEAGRELVRDDPEKTGFTKSYVLGKLCVEAKRSDLAVEFYRIAIKAQPEQAATLYQELTDHLLDVEQYAEAAEVLREAADTPELGNARVNFLFRLSQAEELAGNTDKALSAVRDAQRMLPNIALLHYQEAWIYYHSRQFERAIELYEDVIKRFSNSGNDDIIRRAHFSLSALYVQIGDIAKGEQILEKILVTDPDDPGVNNDLGYLYADQGKNLEKAEKMIKKALNAEPDNAAYLDSMGWVLYKQGRFDEAVTYLEKAVEMPSGSDSTIWDHLGDTYERLDKVDKARQAWTKALEDARNEAHPDEKEIKRIEQKLKGDAEGSQLKPEDADSP